MFERLFQNPSKEVLLTAEYKRAYEAGKKEVALYLIERIF